MTDNHPTAAIPHPHRLSGEQVSNRLQSSPHGLSMQEAGKRAQQYGKNTLPRARKPGVGVIFLRQFLNPLIYILVFAGAVSLFLGEMGDAGFIFAVLMINALIGAVQEFSAQKSADALQKIVTTQSRVLRDGEAFEIDAEDIVPGDIVLLNSGSKVPADIRLLGHQGLEVDESLLTGESIAVHKDAESILDETAALGDRSNMAFAGTHVTRGRGRGVVVATGLSTELGQLAASILGRKQTPPPLILRMKKFTFRLAISFSVISLLIGIITYSQGMPLQEIFFIVVALAVASIPEGLPVAITVALAIGMKRMAKQHVIVRHLVAIESLGSCTCIATDKTGTLTHNELTARAIMLPTDDQSSLVFEASGEGVDPEGHITGPHGEPEGPGKNLLTKLLYAITLCNEGFLGHRDGSWASHGDSIDVASLVLAYKAGITQPEALIGFPQIAHIPFESEHQFAATLHRVDDKNQVFIKGGADKLLTMCSEMATLSGNLPINTSLIEKQIDQLANQGYRIIAVATGDIKLKDNEVFSIEHLKQLTFLGLIGMLDPLRKEAQPAIESCHAAGIQVQMITGDHPATAFNIARELGLTNHLSEVVTGPQLKQAQQSGDDALDALTAERQVFSRVEPQQKLNLVKSLIRNGQFVAVTGDGANDAPALRAAHVGVAMGKKGTDIARESAEIIIANDNFASIVSGIEQGRVIYANIRKVIFLLISTGAAEIVLFMLSLLSGLPLPLLAVQLLWLNLVTNGIQDVALAFEPEEGDEMAHPPRPPGESIFNRLMIQRVILSALTIGILAFVTFQWLLANGFTIDQARNSTLLLMVLFENVHVFNSRSESRSAFTHNPLRNPLLLWGTLAAQLIHIGAMYTPGLSDILNIEPVPMLHWLSLAGVALILLVTIEIHKLIKQRQHHVTQ